MTTDPLAQMEAVRDAIVAAGVRCVLDARDVNPPAVLVRPPTLGYRFGRGCVSATWRAWLYLPDAGQIDALRVGFPMLDTINGALGSIGVALLESEPADFNTADGATLPGFVLSWNTSQ